ncbi:hypothetical protein QO004_003335 [Rhizobium mesoamericanum]|nr:hypothetical protein [Rhizobium mesoamericanum]
MIFALIDQPIRSDLYDPGLGGKTMVLLPFMNTR